MQKYIDGLNKSVSNQLLENSQIDISKHISSNSDTGYKGVYKHKDKFRVQLVHNYNKYSLGVYSDLNLAAKKYAMTNLLLKNTMKGGVSFNTGSDDTKCKKKTDCKDAFDDLKKNEKVKCNRKSGMCERYIHVSKHIIPKSINCKKKENKDLAECINNKNIDCRKKKNRDKPKCQKDKPDCRFTKNKSLDICN